jgi:hypothetical protein
MPARLRRAGAAAFAGEVNCFRAVLVSTDERSGLIAATLAIGAYRSAVHAENRKTAHSNAQHKRNHDKQNGHGRGLVRPCDVPLPDEWCLVKVISFFGFRI